MTLQLKSVGALDFAMDCHEFPAIQIWNQLGGGGQRSYVITSHPLSHRSIGAFWNLLGSMTEIELPVFVLLNTCR